MDLGLTEAVFDLTSADNWCSSNQDLSTPAASRKSDEQLPNSQWAVLILIELTWDQKQMPCVAVVGCLCVCHWEAILTGVERYFFLS